MEADHFLREVFVKVQILFFDLLFELSIDIMQISVVTNLRFNVYLYYKPIFVNSISKRAILNYKAYSSYMDRVCYDD